MQKSMIYTTKQLHITKALKHIQSAIRFGAPNDRTNDGFSHLRQHTRWSDDDDGHNRKHIRDPEKDPKYSKRFEIRKSGLPKAGKGLFTKKLIRAGTLIGRYKGDKLSDKAAADESRKDTSCMFQVWTYDDDLVQKNPDLKRGTSKNPKKFVIDGASPSRCLMSYANSANTESEQNAEFRQKGHKIWLYALHDIKPDQEILTWYGDDDAGEGVGTSAMMQMSKSQYDPNVKLRYTGKISEKAPYISDRAAMVHKKKIAKALQVQYTNREGKLVNYRRGDLEYDINNGYLETVH